MATLFYNRGGCLRAANGGASAAAFAQGSGLYPLNYDCPGTQPVNGCPGACRGTNGLPCGGYGYPVPGPGFPGPAFPVPPCSENSLMAASTGFFTQQGALTLSAGGIVPFNGVNLMNGMNEMAGRIYLGQGGTYLAMYNVELPAQEAAAAQAETEACCLQITLNGVSVPGGDIHLGTGEDYANSRSGQAVFNAMPGSVVSLVSNGALDLTADQSGDTLITLTLMRL